MSSTTQSFTIQAKRKVEAFIEGLRRGTRSEDNYFELKRQWPEPSDQKTARQLAGLLNAAKGEQMMLVIGFNEDGSAHAFKPIDFATWWPQVIKHFESPVPSPRKVDFEIETHAVVALVFDAIDTPYLVKVPGGANLLEIPWRAGSQTRSAQRSDLVSLFQSKRPRVDFIKTDADCSIDRRERKLEGRLELIVNAASDNELIFLAEDVHITARFADVELAHGFVDQCEFHGKSSGNPLSPQAFAARGSRKISMSWEIAINPNASNLKGDLNLVFTFSDSRKDVTVTTRFALPYNDDTSFPSWGNSGLGLFVL